MFTYLGWLYLNLKWRLNDWWNGTPTDQTIPTPKMNPQRMTTPRVRYNYNYYGN